MAKAKPLRTAAGISSDRCEHGTMFVILHGKDGQPFASAAMQPEEALEFLTGFGDKLEAILAEREAASAPESQAVH